MNRYSSKRHRGPNDRGFQAVDLGMEGNIPVVQARKENWLNFPDEPIREGVVGIHVRGFYCHPTKGWRSTGPEGRR